MDAASDPEMYGARKQMGQMFVGSGKSSFANSKNSTKWIEKYKNITNTKINSITTQLRTSKRVKACKIIAFYSLNVINVSNI